LLVFKVTGSALNLGLTAVSTFLPYLLFGLIIGALVDRADRKRLMIFVDLARTLGIATIPLMASLSLLSIWWIYGGNPPLLFALTLLCLLRFLV
jgi:MFS family permease